MTFADILVVMRSNFCMKFLPNS